MKNCYFLNLLLITLFCVTVVSPALAHFGMLIPSDSMVMQQDPRNLKIEASFSHPFEGVGMILEKPKAFGVFVNGKTTNLLSRLEETKIMGHKAWMIDYKIKRPGIYQFHMEPQPYWEPAEDCFIIHYTKTLVAAFGDEEGWNEEIGLKTEIVPLTRPIGLYAGNTFQGVVKLDGKAVPFAEVEIEYYNRDGSATAPTEYMITQVVRADANGIFTYAPPRAGWWGFAALNNAEEKIELDGVEKDVELGAVLWLEFVDWQTR
jgi:cobalt/nickel transport protein